MILRNCANNNLS